MTLAAAGAIGVVALVLVFVLRVAIAIVRAFHRNRVSRRSVQSRKRAESQGRGW